MTAFLSQIAMFAGNFAPRGWALCNGQLLPINQNQALFSLLGTTYGGDGRVNFALPDLRGRVPIHPPQGVMLGSVVGAERRTFNVANLPPHTHGWPVSEAPASVQSPVGARMAIGPTPTYAAPETADAELANGTASAGQGSDGNNMGPYSTLTFIIAITGIFPARN